MPDAKKSPVVCWRYALPPIRHEGWAIVHVDSHGFFGVVSDFGNYAFHWSAFGDDFRQFLTEISADYLCGKLGGAPNHLDVRATTQRFREDILHDRRDGRLDRQRARELWTTTEEFRHELISFEELVEAFSAESPDCWEWGYYDFAPALRGFAQHIWPRLMTAIRTDLDADTAERSLIMPTDQDCFWWCPDCKVRLDPAEVSYEETHDGRRGGYGGSVVWTTATDVTGRAIPRAEVQ